MDNITIEPASKADLSEASRWTGVDSPNSLLFKTRELGAAPSVGAHYWAAKQNGHLVGIVSLNMDENRTGHMELIVKPTERGQGIGAALMQKTMLLPEVKEALWLRFITKHGNVAAKRVLREHGFHERFVNEDGGVVFERRA
jgi:ribosomal protein S18 acetylase RimI-like enzyme